MYASHRGWSDFPGPPLAPVRLSLTHLCRDVPENSGTEVTFVSLTVYPNSLYRPNADFFKASHYYVVKFCK